MAIHQLFATHCQANDALLGRAGYGPLKACSLQDPKKVQFIWQAITSYIRYDPPTGVQDPLTAPPRLFYVPKVEARDSWLRVAGLVSYCKASSDGRPHSWFAHLLIEAFPQSGEPAWDALDVLRLWKSPGWKTSRGEWERQVPEPLETPEELLDGAARDVVDMPLRLLRGEPEARERSKDLPPEDWSSVQTEQWRRHFARVFNGLLRPGQNSPGGKLVLFGNADIAAFVLMGVCRLLPRSVRHRLAFCTYAVPTDVAHWQEFDFSVVALPLHRQTKSVPGLPLQPDTSVLATADTEHPYWQVLCHVLNGANYRERLDKLLSSWETTKHGQNLQPGSLSKLAEAELRAMAATQGIGRPPAEPDALDCTAVADGIVRWHSWQAEDGKEQEATDAFLRDARFLEFLPRLANRELARTLALNYVACADQKDRAARIGGILGDSGMPAEIAWAVLAKFVQPSVDPVVEMLGKRDGRLRDILRCANKEEPLLDLFAALKDRPTARGAQHEPWIDFCIMLDHVCQGAPGSPDACKRALDRMPLSLEDLGRLGSEYPDFVKREPGRGSQFTKECEEVVDKLRRAAKQYEEAGKCIMSARQDLINVEKEVYTAIARDVPHWLEKHVKQSRELLGTWEKQSKQLMSQMAQALNEVKSLLIQSGRLDQERPRRIEVSGDTTESSWRLFLRSHLPELQLIELLLVVGIVLWLVLN